MPTAKHVLAIVVSLWLAAIGAWFAVMSQIRDVEKAGTAALNLWRVEATAELHATEDRLTKRVERLETTILNTISARPARGDR